VDGLAEVEEDLEDLAGDFTLHFGLLVGVARGAEHNQLAFPSRFAELLAEDVCGVGLDDDSGLKVAAGVVAEVFVCTAGKAIGASVLAAAVWVDAPLEPGRDRLVDDGFALDLFEGDSRCHGGLQFGKGRIEQMCQRVKV
jgi:hypothetical protein